MNTTKTGMRTVLAAAAAGALILGSAGGVVATPDKAQGPKTSASETKTMTKLQTVRIKGHKKIDLADEKALQTQLKLRAKVRYSKKVKSEAVPVSLKLAVYDKKVNGEMVGVESKASELALKTKKKERKNQFYAGNAKFADVWFEAQKGALAEKLAETGKAYICISSVEQTFDKFSQQTRMRLGEKAAADSEYNGKIVRDCVKVVDTTPAES